MRHLERSKEITGYKVKIMRREAFTVVGIGPVLAGQSLCDDGKAGLLGMVSFGHPLKRAQEVSMFVYRTTRLVKKDKTREVAERWAEGLGKSAPHAWRVYTQGIGPRDTVVAEVEYESYAEFEKVFTSTLTSSFVPQGPFNEWWAEVGVPGGTDEVWNLAAWGK